MPKITNDGLTRSGTGCFIAVPDMAEVGVKGLRSSYCEKSMLLGILFFSCSLLDVASSVTVRSLCSSVTTTHSHLLLSSPFRHTVTRCNSRLHHLVSRRRSPTHRSALDVP